MKNFTLSVATVLALSTFAVAGGDIEPVVEPVVVEEVASDSGFYIGGALSQLNTESTYHDIYGWIDGDEYTYTNTDEEVTSAFMLQAGYEFNDYIAIEGRYWDTLGDPYEYSWSSTTNGVPNGSGADGYGDFSAWGIYVKPMYPVTESLDVYALLGYGNVSADGYNLYGEDLDENGFQWGIGASYSLTENTSFFIDYVQLCNDEGDSASYTDGYWDYETVSMETSIYTLNLGLSYKF